MEGVDEYHPVQEKHIAHDLPPVTPEQIALQALVDKLYEQEKYEDM